MRRGRGTTPTYDEEPLKEKTTGVMMLMQPFSAGYKIR
jgi:hypothetical protein